MWSWKYCWKLGCQSHEGFSWDFNRWWLKSPFDTPDVQANSGNFPPFQSSLNKSCPRCFFQIPSKVQLLTAKKTLSSMAWASTSWSTSRKIFAFSPPEIGDVLLRIITHLRPKHGTFPAFRSGEDHFPIPFHEIYKCSIIMTRQATPSPNKASWKPSLLSRGLVDWS